MKTNQHTLYTILLCLYQLQGTLYPSGGFISRGFLLLILLLSFFYYIKVITSYKLNFVLASLNVLVLLFVVYGLIRAVSHPDGFWVNTNSNTDFFKNHMSSILPIFSYYYFARKGLLTERWFKRFTVVFFIVVTLSFFREEAARLQDAYREEVVVNASYKWVALIPILVFHKRRPLVQYSLLLIILYFVLTGMKRGAILIAALSTLVFIWESIKSTRRTRRLLVFILIGLAVIWGMYYIEELISSSSFFAQRMEDTMEGDASGREVLYPVYFDFFISQRNILHIILGNGADATVRELGLLAHMDWLEIAIDMGIIGLIAYLWYWISVFVYWNKSRFVYRDAAICIGIFIIIYFTKSLISMSISNMMFYSTSVLGYWMGKTDDVKHLYS